MRVWNMEYAESMWRVWRIRLLPHFMDLVDQHET